MKPSATFDDRPAGSPPPVEPVIAWTRVKGRRPEWKSHTTLRAARSAVSFHAHGGWGSSSRTFTPELWIFADGEWRQEVRS